MNILITGGAGSLGKAFVKLLHKKHHIIVIDNNEWAVAELEAQYPNIEIYLKDIEKYSFNQHPCEVLIHCAAYKHINLGEDNPHAFIDNNLSKTGKLFAEAYKYNVDIIFISSDKAVEPISTYGFTKALGEKLATHYNGYVVRLGNILSSSGSVIPVWEKAIKERRPIPVTDTEMKRYVIEENEAVKAIWRGYKAGEKLIIPKCREINILNLLSKVLKKHNRKVKKVDIKVIGIRPGEKIKEKLKWEWE